MSKSPKVSIAAMHEHVATLIEQHEIAAYRVDRPTRAQSLGKFCWEIHIAPVKSAISYAVALHEIGHLLGRHQESRKVMVRERWAWIWARQHALAWTPAMERQARESLEWYAPRARAIDAKWRPTEWSFPTEDSA
jgi:hypothetical protein